MQLIEQTLTFCRNLLPKDTSEQKEEKKATETKVFNANEEILLKKEDRDEEFFYAPTKKKKGPKGKSGGDDMAKKPIKHNAETFKLFDTLGLEAPIRVSDVPALVEELEKKMETCKEKIERFEEHKEEMKKKIEAGAL